MKRRKFLTVAGATGAATLSGCTSLLEDDVESEPLECDSTDSFAVETHEYKKFEENEWVSNLEGGAEAGAITVNYDGDTALVEYGEGAKSVVGVIDDTGYAGGGIVHVGNYNHEGEEKEVFRYFMAEEMDDDSITVETGLDMDVGVGEASFGHYEDVCRP